MEVKVLPKKTLLLWQIRMVAINLFFLLLAFYFRAAYSFAITLGVAVTIISLFCIFWYLPRYIASYKIRIDNGAVIINRGVFVKTTHIMPYSRMIYIQIIITPIAKIMGLEAFSLKAARSSIIIPEMLKSDAKEILETLTLGGGDEKGI